VRVVEHVFRPRLPLWIWPALLCSLAIGVAAGYFLNWWVAVPALGNGVLVAGLRPARIRLERDERGALHLVKGRGNGTSIDLSRLTGVTSVGDQCDLSDEDGARVSFLLDERLRNEVNDAALRRRLELSRETEDVLAGRGPSRVGFGLLVLFTPGVLIPVLAAGFAVLFGGGITVQRAKAVDASALRAANAVPGAVANPFSGSDPRELYLVPLDATSQHRLPRLSHVLAERFGMQGTLVMPLVVGVGMVDRHRRQLDGWRVAVRLLTAHQAAHPGRPEIVIAVTRLDTFDSRFPADHFAFMTSLASSHNEICGGLISTARFHVWPGSVERRLDKMAGRLLGRCIGVEQDVSIRSIRDVDGLDDRAGADDQTIARQVAARRALPRAPTR
jgi:hypothetical protein